MSAKEEEVIVTERGKHPYFKFLKTTFPLPTIDSRTDTPEARHLQSLLTAGDTVGYDREKAKYELEGHKFRLTDMVLYESFETERTIDVKVAVQALQAKEGRRPRPVVPGSLRAGCFSAGKI